MMRDRPNARFVSSHKSLNIDFDATINPMKEPWTNLVIKAHQKFVLNPKASVAIDRPAADVMRANFVPLLSTTYPHTKLKIINEWFTEITIDNKGIYCLRQYFFWTTLYYKMLCYYYIMLFFHITRARNVMKNKIN